MHGFVSDCVTISIAMARGICRSVNVRLTHNLRENVVMIIDGKRYNSLVELEEDASALPIDPSALGYFRSGAESETTLRRNREQYDEYRLVPRCLVNVSEATTSCRVLGENLSMPVMVAPMAMQKLAHPLGELGMKNGSSAAGVSMLLSTMSTTRMEDIAHVHDSTGIGTFFQLYCMKDRDLTKRIIERADRLGFRGIVITVDAPVLGKRESDEKSQFALPEGLELAILEAEGAGGGDRCKGTVSSGRGAGGLDSKFGSEFTTLIDDSLDWSVIGFCRRITRMPIIVKGVLSKEDAKLAVKHGVDAIVVSNHGGRQLDHCVGTLDVLQEISSAVRGRCEVWVDGGIRRGTDVVKAIALGADAVLIGRPALWALALGGADGVETALRELQGELLRTMKLMGCVSIVDLKRKRSSSVQSVRD